MTDRSELMEAALESFPEGLALLREEGTVDFWNRTAERITGFPSMEMVTRAVPWALDTLFDGDAVEEVQERQGRPKSERGSLIHVEDRFGRELSLMRRTVVLRDVLGVRVGTAIIFHRAEGLDSPHHGESCEDSNLEAAQEEIEEQVTTAFEEFAEGGAPLGLLWITVDQAQALRKSHGASACETMLERIERTLTNGMHPTETIGRWGDDEFLVLSHEPTPELLAAHAQALAGMARTSDFRWWGDRLSLSVSIGAAQAVKAETLPQFFERVQAAMRTSVHAGGNHITLAPER
ncbi:MAG: diguanylate cyclase [Terracidiphilus sp.]